MDWSTKPVQRRSIHVQCLSKLVHVGANGMIVRYKRIIVLGIFVLGSLASVVLYFYGRSMWYPVVQKAMGSKTVDGVVASIGSSARDRISPLFEAADQDYPPAHISLLAVKDRAILELWAGAKNQPPVFITSYDIKALSGNAGPKLREGDRQVPEGLYKVLGLNPNSSYHLSMKLNYPNGFDLTHAEREGRTEPGSNIFIHGKAVSVGCLAMGDTVIEELFVLAADVGYQNIKVVIAPADPRIAPLEAPEEPVWTVDLYKEITTEFSKYQRAQ